MQLYYQGGERVRVTPPSEEGVAKRTADAGTPPRRTRAWQRAPSTPGDAAQAEAWATAAPRERRAKPGARAGLCETDRSTRELRGIDQGSPAEAPGFSRRPRGAAAAQASAWAASAGRFAPLSFAWAASAGRYASPSFARVAFAGRSASPAFAR